MSRLAAPGAIVCIPARDEEERLPALLASLAAQDGFGPEAQLGIVVLANGCSDATASRAQAFAAERLAIRVIEAHFAPTEAHVGTARRRALDEGAAWLEAEGLADGILLSTDADATLPPNWAQANVAALAKAEIVGGALVIAADEAPGLAALHEAVARYWRAVRAIEDQLDPPAHDPAPRHGDHTGASLALRVSTYRDVGGLPALPRGEDNALVTRIVQAGGRLRHDPAIHVAVSDRTTGRASDGMATDMARRLAVMRGEDAYRLPHPDHWRDFVGRRAALRAAWHRGPDAALAALRENGLDADAIAAVDIATCPNDIAFVERASARLVLPEPDHLPVEEALALFDPPARRGAA